MTKQIKNVRIDSVCVATAQYKKQLVIGWNRTFCTFLSNSGSCSLIVWHKSVRFLTFESLLTAGTTTAAPTTVPATTSSPATTGNFVKFAFEHSLFWKTFLTTVNLFAFQRSNQFFFTADFFSHCKNLLQFVSNGWHKKIRRSGKPLEATHCVFRRTLITIVLCVWLTGRTVIHHFLHSSQLDYVRKSSVLFH